MNKGNEQEQGPGFWPRSRLSIALPKGSQLPAWINSPTTIRLSLGQSEKRGDSTVSSSSPSPSSPSSPLSPSPSSSSPTPHSTSASSPHAFSSQFSMLNPPSPVVGLRQFQNSIRSILQQDQQKTQQNSSTQHQGFRGSLTLWSQQKDETKVKKSSRLAVESPESEEENSDEDQESDINSKEQSSVNNRSLKNSFQEEEEEEEEEVDWKEAIDRYRASRRKNVMTLLEKLEFKSEGFNRVSVSQKKLFSDLVFQNQILLLSLEKEKQREKEKEREHQAPPHITDSILPTTLPKYNLFFPLSLPSNDQSSNQTPYMDHSHSSPSVQTPLSPHNLNNLGNNTSNTPPMRATSQRLPRAWGASLTSAPSLSSSPRSPSIKSLRRGSIEPTDSYERLSHPSSSPPIPKTSSSDSSKKNENSFQTTPPHSPSSLASPPTTPPLTPSHQGSSSPPSSPNMSKPIPPSFSRDNSKMTDFGAKFATIEKTQNIQISPSSSDNTIGGSSSGSSSSGSSSSKSLSGRSQLPKSKQKKKISTSKSSGSRSKPNKNEIYRRRIVQDVNLLHSDQRELLLDLYQKLHRQLGGIFEEEIKKRKDVDDKRASREIDMKKEKGKDDNNNNNNNEESMEKGSVSGRRSTVVSADGPTPRRRHQRTRSTITGSLGDPDLLPQFPSSNIEAINLHSNTTSPSLENSPSSQEIIPKSPSVSSLSSVTTSNVSPIFTPTSGDQDSSSIPSPPLSPSSLDTKSVDSNDPISGTEGGVGGNSGKFKKTLLICSQEWWTEDGKNKKELLQQLFGHDFESNERDNISGVSSSSSSSLSIPPENEDSYSELYWYKKFFLIQDHKIFIEENNPSFGPMFVSIAKHLENYLFIFWTINGQLKKKVPIVMLKKPKPIDQWKEREFAIIDERLSNSNLTLLPDSFLPSLGPALVDFENQIIKTKFKFGVILCTENQNNQTEILSNSEGSPDFQSFCSFLGDQISLEGWNKYAGGLDTQGGLSGKNAIYSEWDGCEVIFHLSTMFPKDSNFLQSRMHILNDFVVIVYLDGEVKWNPNIFQSPIINSFIVIQRQPKKKIRMNVSYRQGSAPVQPLLRSSPVYELNDSFRKFFFTKLINLDISGSEQGVLGEKFKKTKQLSMESLVSKYAAKIK